MATKLARITQLSKENPDMVFSSIGHLINMEMLKDCHSKMDKNKAVGIDGVTKEGWTPGTGAGVHCTRIRTIGSHNR